MDWAQTKPTKLDDPTRPFSANVIGTFLPEEVDIPQEFRANRGSNAWCRLATRLFNGQSRATLRVTAKDDVDMVAALQHVGVVLGSHEPKYEHKIAGAGYLLSLWLKEFHDEAPAPAPAPSPRGRFA